jgi:hypothetical protein
LPQVCIWYKDNKGIDDEFGLGNEGSYRRCERSGRFDVDLKGTIVNTKISGTKALGP